jgi:hypothetical protein
MEREEERGREEMMKLSTKCVSYLLSLFSQNENLQTVWMHACLYVISVLHSHVRKMLKMFKVLQTRNFKAFPCLCKCALSTNTTNSKILSSSPTTTQFTSLIINSSPILYATSYYYIEKNYTLHCTLPK